MKLAIDRYEVKRLLGQGAMGKIYLADDPKLGREVAIKVLNARAAKTDKDIRERFRLEARAIASLKHPNIVELYDYSGPDADNLFLVLEYVPGLTLYDHIVERGPVSEMTALCVGHELLLALEHAHKHSVVHRDIKPENVLLTDGRVVLTDFGIVKQIAAEGVLGSDMDRTQTQILGTPGFMAPEQISGRGVTTQTDLFALGALLYNLTTGMPPFTGNNVAIVSRKASKGKYDDPREHNPLLSEGFCTMLARCLAARPKDRFADAAAARDDVLAILRAHGVSEIRKEILEYQENPAAHAIEQRERALEVLQRDLKLAVRDRDEKRVQAIAERMQRLAPVRARLRDVTGVRWSRKEKKVRLEPKRGPSVRGPFLAGAAAGLVVGIALTLLLDAWGVIPSFLKDLFTQVGTGVAGLFGG